MAKMHITLETGTVIAVEDGPGGRVALVTMDPPETGEEGCATCRMCSAKGGCERVLQADAGDNAALSEGARVEVEISRPSLYGDILAVLLLPLVGMVAGGASGALLASGRESRDLTAALCAFAGGVLLFALGYLRLKKTGRQRAATARLRRTL